MVLSDVRDFKNNATGICVRCLPVLLDFCLFKTFGINSPLQISITVYCIFSEHVYDNIFLTLVGFVFALSK